MFISKTEILQKLKFCTYLKIKFSAGFNYYINGKMVFSSQNSGMVGYKIILWITVNHCGIRF